jgi:hypothetical protein
MVTDALSKNRTDGAPVRVITPMANNEAAAQARLVSFIQSLFSQLDEIIPRQTSRKYWSNKDGMPRK